jgi:hypothetical protein
LAVAISARIVPSKILAVVTASVAISAARIVPSKIFAVVTASSAIATNPVLSIVTALIMVLLQLYH